MVFNWLSCTEIKLYRKFIKLYRCFVSYWSKNVSGCHVRVLRAFQFSRTVCSSTSDNRSVNRWMCPGQLHPRPVVYHVTMGWVWLHLDVSRPFMTNLLVLCRGVFEPVYSNNDVVQFQRGRPSSGPLSRRVTKRIAHTGTRRVVFFFSRFFLAGEWGPLAAPLNHYLFNVSGI